MITTNNTAINWMIERTTEYHRDGTFTAYQFKGNVPARMRQQAIDWMKSQNANMTDGRNNTAYQVKLEETIDREARRYRCVNLVIKSGNYNGTANKLDLMLTIDDEQLSEEDMATLTA